MTQAVAPNVRTPAAAPGAQAVPPPDAGAEAMIAAAVQEISHIATLPEITLKIIKLVEAPDSTAQDLNKIITNDPALGARILKVVNSAFYGLPGQIGSINRAIVLLGLNAVKNIAIAASLAKLFRGGQISPSFNAKGLWTHSIAVATGTRLLAEASGFGLVEEAFLAGLIHDLGIMVELQAKRAKFIETLEKLDAEPSLTMRQAERAIIGATHEQFGAALCKAWKFPASFAYVTGFHHRPLEMGSVNHPLTGMVHIADVMAAAGGLGYSRSVEVPSVAAIAPQVLQKVNLTAAQVEEAAAELPKAIKEAAALLGDAA